MRASGGGTLGSAGGKEAVGLKCKVYNGVRISLENKLFSFLVNGEKYPKYAHLFCKRCAFTLAEVLVTLGVIAVVAALTMPRLIENHQKRVISGQLKEFVSIFNQAFNTSKAFNGDSETWEITPLGHEALPKYIYPYLKTTECNTSDNYREAVSYLPRTIPLGNALDRCSAIVNGSYIFNYYDWGRQSEYSATTLFVDVNGEKGPNKFGKDIWQFALYYKSPKSAGDNGVDMSGTGNSYIYYANGSFLTGLQISGACYIRGKRTCSQTYYPKCIEGNSLDDIQRFCGGLLQSNNWEFPDNYPWRELDKLTE